MYLRTVQHIQCFCLLHNCTDAGDYFCLFHSSIPNQLIDCYWYRRIRILILYINYFVQRRPDKKFEKLIRLFVGNAILKLSRTDGVKRIRSKYSYNMHNMARYKRSE